MTIPKTAEELRREREDRARRERRRERAERAPVERAVRKALGPEADVLTGVTVGGGDVNVVLFEDPKPTLARDICEEVVAVRPKTSRIDVEGIGFMTDRGRCERM